MHASARAHLDAGVLLIRDPGGPGHDVVTTGPEQGLPRTINAGNFIAPHGRYFPGMAREIAPDELPGVAVEQATRSGTWAKVIGDFFGPDGRIGPNFELATLREAAQRVHDAGHRITMHAMSADAIQLAIDAGFDAIEHGTSATPEHVAGMASAGITWIPTLIIGDPIVQTVRGQGSPPDELNRWESAVATLPVMVRQAHESGVRILAGTDAGMVAHGLIAREVSLLIEAGLPPQAALAAASWDSRAYLGLPGIEGAAPADLVVYTTDPRVDPAALASPAVRVLDGRVVAD